MFLAVLLLSSVAPAQANNEARGPVPAGQPGTWMSDDNYPAAALRSGAMGTVQFEYDIDARGKVVGCHVIGSSGYWSLDERVCAVATRRASFKPALDATGTAIASTFQSRFTWVIPGRRDIIPTSGASGVPAELTLTVARLPKAYRQPAVLLLRFSSGGVAECRIERSSGSQTVDEVGCAQARQDVDRPAAAGDRAPPDARSVIVTFEPDPAVK